MSAPVGVVMRRAAELAASRVAPPPPRPAAAPGSSDGEIPRTAAVARRRRVRTCTYCPNRALHGSPACWGHQDLLALDPFFSPDVPQKTEPAEDFRPEVLLDRLQTIGA